VNFAKCAWGKAQPAAGFTNASSSIYLRASIASATVAAVFLLITRFNLLYPDWRGYLIAGFYLVWVANVYMSLFARIRLEVKRERVQIKQQEKGVE
jgi:ABC-type Na+ efflux pump permease subunit